MRALRQYARQQFWVTMIDTCYTYSVFGLLVESHIALPALVPASGTPDLRVYAKPITLTDARIRLPSGVDIEQVGHVVRLSVPSVGRVEVCPNSGVALDREEGATDETVRDYVLGPAVGLALHQRQYLVLHGSAVLVNGRAVAFLGSKGAGKSTMAAGLSALGCPLLTDDIVACHMDLGPQVFVAPGPPTLRLADDSALISPGLFSMSPGYVNGKRRYWSGLPAVLTRQELHAVFILADGDACSVEPVPLANAIRDLTRNAYFAFVLPILNASSRHFQQCMNLMGRCKVRMLLRPRVRSVFNEVMRLIEQEIAAS